MEIGQRVQTRREALSLTQQQLATELQVTHQHISRLENSQVAPSADLVARLSRALGVTADYLLFGQDNPRPDTTGAIRADPHLSAPAKRHLLALIDELRTNPS